MKALFNIQSINSSLLLLLFLPFYSQLTNNGYILAQILEHLLTVNPINMINHVVLFKLKEFDSQEEKQDVLNQFKVKLLNLKNFIPELKYIEVGQNYQLNSASFDLCLITHFKSIDDLKIYQVHPEHLKVVEFVKIITSNRAAVDFEF